MELLSNSPASTFSAFSCPSCRVATEEIEDLISNLDAFKVAYKEVKTELEELESVKQHDEEYRRWCDSLPEPIGYNVADVEYLFNYLMQQKFENESEIQQLHEEVSNLESEILESDMLYD